MHRIIIAGFIASLMAAAATAACAPVNGSDTPAGPGQTTDVNEVDLAIRNLQGKAAELKSYQARLDYTTTQTLLESKARREGVLYYTKSGNRSHLRMDFLNLQQDDEPKRSYVEQFVFDGVWLVIVNHQTQRVERRQMAEPNEPVDAFSLAGRHMPMLGFSKTEDLRKQFDVAIVPEPQGPAALQHLHLTTRPDSAYKYDYTTIDVWIDRKTGLPARLKAVTPEEESHEIRLIDPKINRGIEPKMFQVSIPRGFTEEVIPLEKTTPQKQQDPRRIHDND
jgi:outer membrane lipoprotein-sorting protein